MTLKHTDTYKYLGEVKNTKNNLEDHIKEIRGKAEAAYQTLLTVAQNNNFKNIEMEAVWKLYDACIQPIITYGAENWNFDNKQNEKINSIQEAIIRRILMTPVSTPKEALYSETGLLDIEHIALIKKINMAKRLENNPSKIIDKIFEGNERTWKDRLNEDLNEKGITPEHTTNKYKTKNKIRSIFNQKIMNNLPNKSKLVYMKNTEQNYTIKRKNYLRKLNRKQASTIFKYRTRMLDVKCNLKNKYKDLKCRLCGSADETQDHVLFECHQNDNTLQKSDLNQDNDMNKLKSAASKIIEVLDTLNEAPPTQ